jgi:hypothetical protein
VAGDEQHRVLAAADQHRARLAAREVLLHDEAALLAGRHPQPGRLLVVHHDAIGGGVDPARVRIAHDDHVVGADIAPAVELVDERRRELQQVHVVVAIDIRQDRAVCDLDRRDQLEFLLHMGAHAMDQVHLVRRLGQAQHHGEPSVRIGRARQHAEARGVAGDIVEQQRRRATRIARRHGLRHRADLQVPVGALDALQLAHLLELFQQLAQALIPDIRPRGGRGIRFVTHPSTHFPGFTGLRGTHSPTGGEAGQGGRCAHAVRGCV